MPLPGPHIFPRPYSQDADVSGKHKTFTLRETQSRSINPREGAEGRRSQGGMCAQQGGRSGSLLTRRPRHSGTRWVSPFLLQAAQLQGQCLTFPRTAKSHTRPFAVQRNITGWFSSPLLGAGGCRSERARSWLHESELGCGQGRSAPTSLRPRPGSFPGHHRQEGRKQLTYLQHVFFRSAHWPATK